MAINRNGYSEIFEKDVILSKVFINNIFINVCIVINLSLTLYKPINKIIVVTTTTDEIIALIVAKII